MNFWFQIIFAWVKRFSEVFDGSTNDADMRLSLALAIKANKVSLFCNQDNKTTAIEGIMPSQFHFSRYHLGLGFLKGRAIQLNHKKKLFVVGSTFTTLVDGMISRIRIFSDSLLSSAVDREIP